MILTTALVFVLLSQAAPPAPTSRPATSTASAPASQPAVVQATGWARARPGLRGVQARLMAERGAQVVAARNLLHKLQTMPADSPQSAERMAGILRGHCFGPATFLPDGTAVVTVEVRVPARD